jgi:hypothetical protein
MAFNAAPTCLPYAFNIYKFRILCDVSDTEYRHHVNIGKLQFFVTVGRGIITRCPP